MAWSSEADEVLEAATAANPQIAEAIAAIPVRQRERALNAAERRFLQTAHALGGGEGAARKWVSTVMRHLQRQVSLKYVAVLRASGRTRGVLGWRCLRFQSTSSMSG